MGAVTASDRAAWLRTYADDAVLHDPVGGLPLDPDASGLQGRPALERFWDLTIEPNDVRFTIAAVHPSGDEAAVVASVDIAFANSTRVAYDGAFVYTVDDAGRIASVRSYFDLQEILAASRAARAGDPRAAAGLPRAPSPALALRARHMLRPGGRSTRGPLLP